MQEKYPKKVVFHTENSNNFTCGYILNNGYVYNVNIDNGFSIALFLYFHTVYNNFVCEYSLFLCKNGNYYYITIEV